MGRGHSNPRSPTSTRRLIITRRGGSSLVRRGSCGHLRRAGVGIHRHMRHWHGMLWHIYRGRCRLLLLLRCGSLRRRSLAARSNLAVSRHIMVQCFRRIHRHEHARTGMFKGDGADRRLHLSRRSWAYIHTGRSWVRSRRVYRGSLDVV